MAFASGSGVRVAYVAETTFGTVPATPAFKTLRVNSGGLRTNKQTVTSDERQADRNVRDEMMTGKDASGTYAFELTYGTFDDLLEGALFNTWATNTLKNGITRKSFTVEETLELGATDSFSRFRGAMVNTFSLDIPARDRITGSMELMAVEEQLATAIVTGATYAAPNTNPSLTSSAHVAALTLTGTGITATPKIRRVGFALTNNLRDRPTVGSIFSQDFGEGRCEVTGTMEAYFENNEVYQKVLDHGSGVLTFTVGAATLNKYTFTFPKIIFGNGERTVGGTDDDVVATIPWRAVYDTTEAATIRIDRAVA